MINPTIFNDIGKKVTKLNSINWFRLLNSLSKIFSMLFSILSDKNEILSSNIFAITVPPIKYNNDSEIAKFVLLNNVSANKNIRLANNNNNRTIDKYAIEFCTFEKIIFFFTIL